LTLLNFSKQFSFFRNPIAAQAVITKYLDGEKGTDGILQPQYRTVYHGLPIHFKNLLVRISMISDHFAV
jgi:hypothetical protein